MSFEHKPSTKCGTDGRCSAKRAYAATAEVYGTPEARTNPALNSGGPVQTYGYDQSGRSYIKRQRSASDYTSPHAYPAYARSTTQPYGMPGGGAYGQVAPQPPQNEQQAHMAGMMSMQQSMMPGWQQSQAQYGAPVGGGMGMSGHSYYEGSTNDPQPPRTQGYSHTSPIYTGRGTGDMYSGMSSLPTPTSEQSMGSTQSSLSTYAHSTQLGAALPSREQHAQHYELSNPSPQYPPQPQSHYPTTQSYQAPGSNNPYEQHPPLEAIKMESQPGYGDSPNLYNAPAQSTYSASDGFSSNDLPLSTGMLNREFSGAYRHEQHQAPQPPRPQEPDPYPEMAGDGSGNNNVPDIPGYPAAKSQPQPAAYPTPHHTSPTSHLQDHG